MRVIESGRILLPAGASGARRWVEEHLLSLHGRAARVRAIARGARMRGVEREASGEELAMLASDSRRDAHDWVLMRDYAGTDRGRSVLFLFDRGGDRPTLVVKSRFAGAPGLPLRHEADVLAGLHRALPNAIAETLPRVEEYVTAEGRETMVLTAVPGLPLAIRMQRSLRPRLACAAELAAAGEWLGTFQAATRRQGLTAVHGDFWPRNILYLEPHTVSGVVDWEQGSLAGSPWDDLFTLPVLFATAPPSWTRLDRGRALARAFAGRGALARAIARYFDAYSRKAGVTLGTIEREFDGWLASRGGDLPIPAQVIRLAIAEKRK